MDLANKEDEVIRSLVTAYLDTGCCTFEDLDCIDPDALQFSEFFKDIQNDRDIYQFNGVHTDIPDALTPLFSSIEQSKTLHRILASIYNIDVEAVPNQLGSIGGKLLIKDHRFDGNIFLHQDSCYQVGKDNTTIFFTLTDCHFGPAADASIRCLLNTHKFGHLGDAGEINRDLLPEDWPEVCFAKPKHHFMLMDPHTWHYSNSAKLTDQVRAIYTLTVNNIPETWTRALGDFTPLPHTVLNPSAIFKRSRSSRLKEMQAKIDQWGGQDL